MDSQPKMRPIQLTHEPKVKPPEPERFFGLDEIADPAELLSRATELADAFSAAAAQAGRYQAIACAELADPRRFDRLTHEEIAERFGILPSDVAGLVERGRKLRAG